MVSQFKPPMNILLSSDHVSYLYGKFDSTFSTARVFGVFCIGVSSRTRSGSAAMAGVMAHGASACRAQIKCCASWWVGMRPRSVAAAILDVDNMGVAVIVLAGH